MTHEQLVGLTLGLIFGSALAWPYFMAKEHDRQFNLDKNGMPKKPAWWTR